VLIADECDATNLTGFVLGRILNFNDHFVFSLAR